MKAFLSVSIILAIAMIFSSVVLAAEPIHSENLIPAGGPWKPVALEEGKTIGQDFKASKSFDEMTIYAPTWTEKTSGFTFTLRKDGPKGKVVHTQKVENATDGQTTFTFNAQAPGKYYAEMSKPIGKIGWWTKTSDVHADGTAYENGQAVNGEDRTLALRLMKEAPVETKPAANPKTGDNGFAIYAILALAAAFTMVIARRTARQR
jgi:hypothetical protein